MPAGPGCRPYTTPSGPGGVSLGLANSVASLGPYYVTSGFVLASTTGLAVVGPVVAGADQTISLTAPSLSVSANGLLEFGTQAGGAFAAMPGAGTFVLPTVQAGPAVSSTVDLTTDALSLAGATTQIYAQGGIVAIEPLTAGLNVTVGGASTWVVASQPVAHRHAGHAGRCRHGRSANDPARQPRRDHRRDRAP